MTQGARRGRVQRVGVHRGRLQRHAVRVAAGVQRHEARATAKSEVPAGVSGAKGEARTKT